MDRRTLSQRSEGYGFGNDADDAEDANDMTDTTNLSLSSGNCSPVRPRSGSRSSSPREAWPAKEERLVQETEFTSSLPASPNAAAPAAAAAASLTPGDDSNFDGVSMRSGSTARSNRAMTMYSVGRPSTSSSRKVKRSFSTQAPGAPAKFQPNFGASVIAAVRSFGKTTAIASVNSKPRELLDWITQKWKCELPQFVLTIKGGETPDFELSHDLNVALKRGLRTVAEATDAWIVTGGKGTGLVKKVGEIMSEIVESGSNGRSIPLIGFFDCMGKKADPELKKVFDKNHTHFFMVRRFASVEETDTDPMPKSETVDSTFSVNKLYDEFLREIANEAYAGRKIFTQSTNDNVRSILLVVGGDAHQSTLDMTSRAVHSRVPVVVMEGSGHTADLLSYAWRYLHDDKVKAAQYRREVLLEKIKSTFFQGKELTDPSVSGKAEEILRNLLETVIMKERVVIFSLDDNETLENAMLRAVMNTLKPAKPEPSSFYELAREKLQLAMSLDRADVAEHFLLAMKVALQNHKAKYAVEESQLEIEQTNSTTGSRHVLGTSSGPSLVDADTINNSPEKLREIPEGIAKGVQVATGLGMAVSLQAPQTTELSDEKLEQDVRDALMWSICENKPQFLNIFVHHISHIAQFLYQPQEHKDEDDKTILCTRLEVLYCNGLSKKKHFRSMIQSVREVSLTEYFWRVFCCLCGRDETFGRLDTVRKLILKLIFTRERPHHQPWKNFRMQDTQQAEEIAYHDLMTWSCLMNNYQLAENFWRLGSHSIANALFCSRLFVAMARMPSIVAHGEFLETRTKMYKLARKFEQLASGVLDECHRESSSKTREILRRPLDKFEILQKPGGKTYLNCLELAIQAKDLSFMSHPACASVVEEQWYGRISEESPALGILICALFPCFSCVSLLMRLRQDEEGVGKRLEEKEEWKHWIDDTDTSKSSKTDQERGKKSWFAKWMFHNEALYDAPVVKFYLDVISFVALVILYMTVVLDTLPSDELNNREYLLAVWMGVLVMEEVRQVLQNRRREWAADWWNWWDTAMYTLFAAAFGWRVCGLLYLEPLNYLDSVKLLYALNLVQFLLRTLRLYAVSKNLGPKLIIIQKMLMDILTFLALFVIVLLCYGVVLHAVLFPQEALSFDSFLNMLYAPYFQTFGELLLQEVQQNTECIGFFPFTSCANYGRLAPVFLAIYLIFSNIMLINLLIAMLAKTYDEVQKESYKIWRFQLYELLMEFKQRPWLPPPLSFFVMVYEIVVYCYRYQKKPVQDKEPNGQPNETANQANPNDDLDTAEALAADGVEVKPASSPGAKFSDTELELFEEKHTERYLDMRDKEKAATESNRIQVVESTVKSMSTLLSERHGPIILEIYHGLRALNIRLQTALFTAADSPGGNKEIKAVDQPSADEASQKELTPKPPSPKKKDWMASEDTPKHLLLREQSSYPVASDRRKPTWLQPVTKGKNQTTPTVTWFKLDFGPHGLVYVGFKEKIPRNILDEPLVTHGFISMYSTELKDPNHCDLAQLQSKYADPSCLDAKQLASPQNAAGEIVKRAPLREVEWGTPDETYNPFEFTSPFVLVHGPEAKKELDKLMPDKSGQNTNVLARYWADSLTFNGTTKNESYCGTLKRDGQRLPLNPIGRTGMRGRGVLGQWGPNMATDTLVTRWKLGEQGAEVERGGKRLLEFLAVKRAAERQWAIPGSLDKSKNAILVKAFGLTAETTEHKSIKETLKQAKSIFKGYMQDPRNTDNAWMETEVKHYHDEDGMFSNRTLMECRDDVNAEVAWITIHSDMLPRMYAEHGAILRRVAIEKKALL
eukprot:m.294431 g.294431  ORF g.294431 m.294431 type:complete len:1804 (-) comp22964_c0_seq3:8-5419(-)